VLQCAAWPAAALPARARRARLSREMGTGAGLRPSAVPPAAQTESQKGRGWKGPLWVI